MYVFPKKNPPQINKGFKAIRCSSNSQNKFQYPQMEACVEAEQNRDGFWKEKSKNLTWDQEPEIIYRENPETQFGYEWFADGKLNMSYNCLDRWLPSRGNEPCIYYDSPVTNTKRTLTFQEMHQWVEQCAGALANLGVGKNDRVLIYMPMVPEATMTMLACSRLGAPHSVVFGGFAAEELSKRIEDFSPKVIVSASNGVEPGKIISYKPLLDKAIELTSEEHRPKQCLIFQRPGYDSAPLVPGRDLDWMSCVEKANPVGPTMVDSNHLLYILYTSGTTAAPKGVMRDTGGYATALSYIQDEKFNCRAGDVSLSTTDIGWVVGHSFIVYGPLLNGCTSILYEGKPVGTPDAGAYWRMVEEYNVKMLWTAPTAVRAIRRQDPNCDEIRKYNISSLDSMFIAGERLDPTSLTWLEDHVGDPNDVHISDHWWQTETGWPITGRFTSKEPIIPRVIGSCGYKVPGMNVDVVEPLPEEQISGEAIPIENNISGEIVVKLPLPPGCLMGLYKQPERNFTSYLEKYPGYYFTADEGYRDDHGNFHVMSRVDDVINVAGHRLSTGAMEEIIATHEDIAECAVIGVKDELRGQVPVGIAVCKAGVKSKPEEISKQCAQLIRDKFGAVASFKKCYIVEQLPKTRSGKILRRSLREIHDTKDYKVIPATIEDVSALDIFKSVILIDVMGSVLS